MFVSFAVPPSVMGRVWLFAVQVWTLSAHSTRNKRSQ